MALKSIMVRNRDAFTASTDLIDASTGLTVRELALAIQVLQTAAAVVPENVAADTVFPLEVRLNGSPIVSIRGVDLFALNHLYLRHAPHITRAAAVIGNRTRIHNLRMPLNQPARTKGDLQYRFNFQDVANTDTQSLTVSELLSDEPPVGGYIHAVEVPHTLPAATGFGLKQNLSMAGALKGILLFSTTVPAAAADVVSLQELKLFVGKTEVLHRTWYDMVQDAARPDYFSDSTAALALTWMDNYAYLDLAGFEIPEDAEVQWQINAGVASEAVRLIPIYEVGGAPA